MCIPENCEKNFFLLKIMFCFCLFTGGPGEAKGQQQPPADSAFHLEATLEAVSQPQNNTLILTTCQKYVYTEYETLILVTTVT